MQNDRKNRLVELFKKIEYTPFPEMTIKSNVGNQFTDYALNCIVDDLLANGVILPPCKVGDTVYVISRYYTGNFAIYECKVNDIAIYKNNMFIRMLGHNNHIFAVNSTEINDTVFFTKEEAEQKLKENEQ